MNNSPLDEHIKKQFGNYSPDVPPHIWENIVAERDKRKPVGFWLNFLRKNGLFLLLGILLSGGAAILYKNVHAPSGTNKTTATNEIKTTAKTTTNVLPKNELTKNNATATGTSIEKEQPQTINNPSAETKPVAGKDINDAQSDLTSTVTAQTKTKQNDPVTKNSGNGNDTEKPGNGFHRSKHTKGKTLLTYTNATVVADEDKEDKNISTVDILNSNDLLLNRLLLNLDLLHAEHNITATVKKPTVPYLNIPCPESEKNTAGNKRYFELYGGPDYAFRSIKDTGNSTYLQKRKESSRFTSAFSAGIRYTKVFNNGMSFRTGINYSQINEKFKYAEGNIIQVVYIVNSNGDTTGSYTTTGTRYKTTHDKFRTIDIPLLIGYELGNGKFHVNFNAGAIVNLYSWQKGDILDSSYKPVNITTGKAPSSAYQFKTNMGVGFIGSVSVYYKLSSRLHIFAEPYFRYNFSSASKSDLTVKQKYNTAGLRLGIRIDF